MNLFSELKRRNVFRVAAAYLVVGWLLTEVFTTILPTLGAPEWMPRAVILVFVFGFVPAVVLSWVYEIRPTHLIFQRVHHTIVITENLRAHRITNNTQAIDALQSVVRIPSGRKKQRTRGIS